MNSYANYKLTNNDIKNAEDSYKKIMGPSRLNSTIKNTCRFDYVQNICKDWHDSGYCPFGNSCLYLHDRSNVKTGWELEKDFEEQERERWKRINNPELAKK
jgi:RING finger protein 113A